MPRTTVLRWRVAPPPALERTERCPRCGHARHDPSRLGAAYAYLLGLYLGDGHIARFPRRVYRLSIYLDAAYPGIVECCRLAMQDVMPHNSVNVQPRSRGWRMAAVHCYSRNGPACSPSTARGRSTAGRSGSSPWQQTIVADHPRELLRGLLHSDGCRFTNSVRVAGREYAYPRYNFSNASDDIRAIFCAACDRVGVRWRRMNARNVSVARRRSVALLDEFVGPKA